MNRGFRLILSLALVAALICGVICADAEGKSKVYLLDKGTTYELSISKGMTGLSEDRRSYTVTVSGFGPLVDGGAPIGVDVRPFIPFDLYLAWNKSTRLDCRIYHVSSQRVTTVVFENEDGSEMTEPRYIILSPKNGGTDYYYLISDELFYTEYDLPEDAAWNSVIKSGTEFSPDYRFGAMLNEQRREQFEESILQRWERAYESSGIAAFTPDTENQPVFVGKRDAWFLAMYLSADGKQALLLVENSSAAKYRIMDVDGPDEAETLFRSLCPEEFHRLHEVDVLTSLLDSEAQFSADYREGALWSGELREQFAESILQRRQDACESAGETPFEADTKSQPVFVGRRGTWYFAMFLSADAKQALVIGENKFFAKSLVIGITGQEEAEEIARSICQDEFYQLDRNAVWSSLIDDGTEFGADYRYGSMLNEQRREQFAESILQRWQSAGVSAFEADTENQPVFVGKRDAWFVALFLSADGKQALILAEDYYSAKCLVMEISGPEEAEEIIRSVCRDEYYQLGT